MTRMFDLLGIWLLNFFFFSIGRTNNILLPCAVGREEGGFWDFLISRGPIVLQSVDWKMAFV